ncbi:MAG: outer membrane protein assembly factor BamD [Aeromonadales bacterium]|nr:outer membrane protein assembly factor BamD [Aeromonadales bacterium]MDY2890647.1 outer membrane protein assembly factor BamD [Succinivibrio sp.]
MLRKIAVSAALAIALALTGCGSDSDSGNKDKVPDLSAAALYSTAKSAMASSDFSKAKDYLEALDTRYPFGEYTDQVQLDLIYVYYKTRSTDLAAAAVERYQRINPTSIYSDYVAYMKGLVAMQKRGNLFQEFMHLDRSQKDPTSYYDAIKTFSEFIKTYPNSPYVHDARQRIIYMKDQLAEREYMIAKYYFDRGAYLSSARHCQSILYSYRDTQYIDEAMDLMAKDYDKLGLKLPADNTRKVIAASSSGK